MVYVDPVVFCSFFDLKTFQSFQLTSKDSLERLNTHRIALLVKLRREHGEVLYPRLLSTTLPVLSDREVIGLFKYETKVDCFKTTRVLIEYYKRNSVIHRGVLGEVAKREECKSHFLRMITSTPHHLFLLNDVLEQVTRDDLITYFAGTNPKKWTQCVDTMWETVALYGNTAAAKALLQANLHTSNPFNLIELAKQHEHSGYTLCQHGHCNRYLHHAFSQFMSEHVVNFQQRGLHYPQALHTMQNYESEEYVDIDYSDDDFLPFIDYLDEDSDEDI